MATKLWGGRFSKKTDPRVEEFTKSIQYDYKLAEYDLLGSMAQVRILQRAGYLSSLESARLIKALNFIFKSVQSGKFRPDPLAEDIHTQIQNMLQKKAGDLALKLHTARSRNDQVVFAAKLYCKVRIEKLLSAAGELKSALGDLAARGKNMIIPGFTHLQHAQPVMLGDYLRAYAQMLARDSARLGGIGANIKLTLGAGALAGTPVKARDYRIKIGGFNIEPPANSIDSVSDRDFVIEIIGALSILAMHLSRLAEDLIIWSSKEFDFVEIDEAFSTGSSLMPQKKNPDVLELVRGYSGRLYGNLVSVLVMMKGLPLAYNRDMQLDKEPLFNSFEIIFGELKVLAGLIKTLKFNKKKIEEQLKDEFLYATDIVYYLVDKGIAFKDAHTITGKLVRYSLDNSTAIKDMPEKLLKKFSQRFVKKELLRLFEPLLSVQSRRSLER